MEHVGRTPLHLRTCRGVSMGGKNARITKLGGSKREQLGGRINIICFFFVLLEVNLHRRYDYKPARQMLPASIQLLATSSTNPSRDMHSTQCSYCRCFLFTNGHNARAIGARSSRASTEKNVLRVGLNILQRGERTRLNISMDHDTNTSLV